MNDISRMQFPLIASALLALGALLAPTPGQAEDYGNLDFESRSDGGVGIKFSNGCWISYDRNAKRGGHAGSCSSWQYDEADEAARSYLNVGGYSSSGSSSAGPIPEGQMERYCQGEASAKLGTRPTNISTRPVQKRGKDFVVFGQSPQSGYDVTNFECVFGKRGMFKGVQVTGSSSHSSGSSSAGPVPEGQMERYCQGEASAKLGTRPTNISTRSVRKRGSDFVVAGQSPQSGYNVTTFECVFGKRGMFKGVNVMSRGNESGGGYGNNEIPRVAEQKCRDTFGVPAKVGPISPLRPGYWEVIMTQTNGPRSAACTVTSDGQIEDWIELN